MTNITPEQRAQWRADAEVSGPRSCPCGCWPKDNRILALLDALADAWQEGYEEGSASNPYAFDDEPSPNPYRPERRS